MKPKFRWWRHKRQGGYVYACAAELRRESVIVFKDERGWYFKPRSGGKRFAEQVESTQCECCGTEFEGELIGFPTAKAAKEAAEIYISE